MELMDIIKSRRSTRKYTDQKISDQDIEKILESGTYAPSGVDLQPWYYVVVRSPEKLEQVKELMTKSYEAFLPTLEKRFLPKYPQVIEDVKTQLTTLGGATTCVLVFNLRPELNGQTFVYQCIGASVQNMMLQAVDLGLASCYMTAPVETGLGNLFNEAFAPEVGDLICAATFGYADEVPPTPKRKDGRYIVI